MRVKDIFALVRLGQGERCIYAWEPRHSEVMEDVSMKPLTPEAVLRDSLTAKVKQK